jgi:hypothetical protein
MNLKKQFLSRESLVSQLLLYPETNDIQEHSCLLITYKYSDIVVGMYDSYMQFDVNKFLLFQ